MKTHLQPEPSKAQQREPFIKAARNRAVVNQNHEKSADAFAEKVSENAGIRAAFQHNALKKKGENPKASHEPMPEAQPLPGAWVEAFKTHFGKDFSQVRIHMGEVSDRLTSQYAAAALTMGQHIFINSQAYRPGSASGLRLLAHELAHTGQQASKISLEVSLKPMALLQDQTEEQRAALARSVKIAVGEVGKVNSGALNDDKTRVGWPYLLEYFKTTMGPDSIVADKKDYKAGKFLEENIKYLKRGKATKIKIVDGKHTQVVDNQADLLPSWCGIFVFWAYHKGGIHPQPWQLGRPNFSSKDAYKKGEYLPRPGDLVIKNGYNHHAMVVKTSPDTVSDTKDLAGVKVTTINGNTAGSNHVGGQIQLKEDPYSYWDYYVRPFFAGVKVDSAAEYKVDERLKESLGEKTDSPQQQTGSGGNDAGSMATNSYSTELQQVSLGLEKSPKKEKKKTEDNEAPKVDPAEIMAKDKDFKSLNQNLKKNAKEQQTHASGEAKAAEAQASAVSPTTETLAAAKAAKVEKLSLLPRPKEIKAADLKAAILKEVNRLIKEKKDEAARTGDKPKINNEEINDVKEANSNEIQARKTSSVGEVEKTQAAAPDESAFAKRKEADVVVENPGPKTHIPDTERAVAKPLDEDRISLEAESAGIDQKMAENEVDEPQLEESEEPKFTGALDQKRDSQAQAANIKPDYKSIEEEKLAKDKKQAQGSIFKKVEAIHQERAQQFGEVDLVKDKTKTADEQKRQEVTKAIEKIYADAELSVTTKLEALDKTVNEDFDAIMAKANDNFKKSVNDALDEEFTWEWAAKKLDRDDYNRRVAKVFTKESEKYTDELSRALDPLTTRIATTLNAIVDEIQNAKKAVKVYVEAQPKDLQQIALESAKGVMEKFTGLEAAVNEKQESLTNSLAQKYADGVMALEEEFKKIMDSRKSWLEKALDAIVDAIMEIIQLLSDLKKALERAAAYAKRIIKAPLRFFNNLVKGATAGFESFLKNIGKHLLQGALEWITGQMGEAGIILPEKFDFKGILSLILQVLGLSVANVMALARKVIGSKYVDMLEKGAHLGLKVADKMLNIFNILKTEGIAGLWEFIKEQFTDLKERLLEEAKSFIITTIIETAIPKILSMLIPGAGFISAVKSLIDFISMLFAKARQIVSIITGIIDTFGEVLEGNVSKVANMVEGILGKFVSLAISFLAAILGLGKIGKKISDLIQKKIKEPINKAITKVLEKLKTVMTKLGLFKLLDKGAELLKKGAAFVEDKKEKVKNFFKAVVNYIKNKFKKQYTEKDGSSHTLMFNDNMELERHSVTRDLGNHLIGLDKWVNVDGGFKKKDMDSYNPYLKNSMTEHGKIRKLIGEAVKKVRGGEFEGPDKYFSQSVGTELNKSLSKIAGNLREVPALGRTAKAKLPKTIITYPSQTAGGDGQVAEAPLISIDSKFIGSKADAARYDSDLTKNLKKAISEYRGGGYNLVKGHLINHELHGTGAEKHNLGPIPTSGNNQMLQDFEEAAKNKVHEANVIYYKVEYSYGPPKINIDNVRKKVGYATNNKKNAKLVTDLAALGDIPVSVKYHVESKFYKGKDDDTQDKVDQPANWTESPVHAKDVAYKNADSFSFNHEDFF